MLAAEKSKDTFIAPIGIGLALFVAEIAGVYYTGGSLNPARSFGPCVAGASFQGYHWIYWIGPCLGALIAGGYFHFVKFFNYEEANPGQDSAGGDLGEDLSQSLSRSGTDPARQMENGQSNSRPRLDSRIESGTLHPGFQT
jgi:aquaporin rerated protein, other eukaryote